MFSKELAILDDIQVAHMRKVGSGSLYKGLILRPRQEMVKILKKYKISRAIMDIKDLGQIVHTEKQRITEKWKV